MDATPKTWWAPIWCGLVADPDGKHVQRAGVAVWLLLYLIVHARRATGIVRSRRSVIARRMGVPRRSIQRWLTHLEQHGYVTVDNRDGVATIRVLRWKSLGQRATSGAERANPGVLRAKTGAGR